jgi:hypothetical protein
MSGGFLPNGFIAISYVQVLTRGYSKSSVRRVVPHTSACTICRTYVRWSPPVHPHYRQQRTSARPSVCPPKSPNYSFSALSDPKPKLTHTTKLLILVNNLGHYTLSLSPSLTQTSKEKKFLSHRKARSNN